MRILYLAEHYLPRRGGTVTYAVNVFEGVRRLGVDAQLLTFAAPNDAQDEDAVTRVPLPGRLIRADGSLARVASKVQPFLMRRPLQAAFARFRPDLVHVLNGYYVDLLTRHLPCPVVWTIQNVPPQEHGLHVLSGRLHDGINAAYRRFIAVQTRALFEMYRWDRIIAVSPATARLVRKQGVPADDITIIPNGVDPSVFRPLPPAPLGARFPTLVCVAGIAANKGLDVLARALESLLAFYPRLEVQVVGEVRDPTYFAALRKEIARLGQSNHWTFMPPGTQQDVVARVGAAHLYVQPSREEGFCMAVLEALACQRFVVASAVGEIPLFVTSETGMLVEPDRPHELAEAIRSSLVRIENGALRQEAFASAIRPYLWPVIAERTIELYQQVLERCR